MSGLKLFRQKKGSGGSGVTSFNTRTGAVTLNATDVEDALASQTQNKVFASPNGSSGEGSFRALVSADLPVGTPTQVLFFDETTGQQASSSDLIYIDSSKKLTISGNSGHTGITIDGNTNNIKDSDGNPFIDAGGNLLDVNLGTVAVYPAERALVDLNGVDQLLTWQNGKVIFNKGQRVNVTPINDTNSPYAILPSDYLISVDATAAVVTVTLPSTPTTGDTYIVKDTNGNALVNNITIGGNGDNIDGAATKVVNINYQSITVTFTGVKWSIC